MKKVALKILIKYFFLEFFTPVIYISRKRNGKRQKKQSSCSKMLFYYLIANKTRDVFRNSRPLASLRLKNTWGGALISIDLLKVTLLCILFYISIMGLYLGVLICGTTFVLAFWWAYIREVGLIFRGGGAYIRCFTILRKEQFLVFGKMQDASLGLSHKIILDEDLSWVLLAC